jgi:hypothetical protein
MIKCTNCGRPVDKIPSWLEGVKVDLVCNNCPNRQAKNIAFVNLQPESPVVGSNDDKQEDVEEVAEEDAI